MHAMDLKSSMWRRITRGEGEDEGNADDHDAAGRERGAYDEQHPALFNPTPY